MRVFNRSAATLAAIMVAVAACKKAPPPQPAAEPPAPPPPVAVSAFELGKAIGPDGMVTSPLATFGLRDTIYASIRTTGASTNATLTAWWTFQTGQTVDSSSRSIAPTGPATTEFHIMKRTAWPVGKYKVAVLLNGIPAMVKEFEVRR
jgi:hypothetical protein